MHPSIQSLVRNNKGGTRWDAKAKRKKQKAKISRASGQPDALPREPKFSD